MADNRSTGGDQDDSFGWGQKPLHRTDETTGDEGLAPPVGGSPVESTIGRVDDASQADAGEDRDAKNRETDYPPQAPRGDARE